MTVATGTLQIPGEDVVVNPTGNAGGSSPAPRPGVPAKQASRGAPDGRIRDLRLHDASPGTGRDGPCREVAAVVGPNRSPRRVPWAWAGRPTPEVVGVGAAAPAGPGGGRRLPRLKPGAFRPPY